MVLLRVCHMHQETFMGFGCLHVPHQRWRRYVDELELCFDVNTRIFMKSGMLWALAESVVGMSYVIPQLQGRLVFIDEWTDRTITSWSTSE